MAVDSEPELDGIQVITVWLFGWGGAVGMHHKKVLPSNVGRSGAVRGRGRAGRVGGGITVVVFKAGLLWLNPELVNPGQNPVLPRIDQFCPGEYVLFETAPPPRDMRASTTRLRVHAHAAH